MSGNQAQLPGPRGGLGPVGRAELAQDVGHMLFDRVERHHQLAVGQRWQCLAEETLGQAQYAWTAAPHSGQRNGRRRAAARQMA
jgi:hypothetical protein